MRYSLRSVLTILLLAFAMTPFSYAQNDHPVFSVANIEVKPSLTAQAISLLNTHEKESRAQEGNLRFEVLQRAGRPNHFAILDAWQDRQAQEGYASATFSAGFRVELKPMLYSPYDERKSTPILGTSSVGDEGDVYVLTHVDISPRNVERGLLLLEALITASRQEAGAKDVGLIVQDSRQNHMTLFEVWADPASHEAHLSAAHTMHARRELQARIGSLYDERLYRRL